MPISLADTIMEVDMTAMIGTLATMIATDVTMITIVTDTMITTLEHGVDHHHHARTTIVETTGTLLEEGMSLLIIVIDLCTVMFASYRDSYRDPYRDYDREYSSYSR